ncbi:MAG: hypothetical protein ACREE2_18215 [Stellaceae bacterium]
MAIALKARWQSRVFSGVDGFCSDANPIAKLRLIIGAGKKNPKTRIAAQLRGWQSRIRWLNRSAARACR